MAAAVAAVDAAVRKLPAEADVKYSVAAQQEGGWGQRTGDPEPLNPGSKARKTLHRLQPAAQRAGKSMARAVTCYLGLHSKATCHQ